MSQHHEQMTILDRDTYPAEQFEDIDQQYLTVTLGMWGFLITEIMFIGAVFAGFYIYRMRWVDAFVQGTLELKWWLGGINTVVLLTSSFTMVLAVHAAHTGNRSKLVNWLLITFVLGMMFVGIKGFEYYSEYKEGLIPVAGWWNPVDHHGHARPAEMQLFMGFYFVMTGLHALHMVAGLAVLAVILYFAKKGTYTPEYRNPVEMFGLYWHFVDLVWVFLFPTLYLLRHH